ncbi:hypothetical protein AOQ84DRAFT_331864 [Glonium stellatum]|uniref:DUF300-domain-containing protein n=1 Tax=Glonium stellatum TaxID=574774 RepID=A0A8E2JYM4_9PEZI|nr:hypothetical protein AOQ84DRAFT_331864 [Glonium stellatum]
MNYQPFTKLLQPRGLFGSSDSNFTCSRPKPDEHGDLLSIGITFKSLMTYITTAALGLTTISALFLIWKHLHRYTTPKEQRQNVRIIAMPVFFSIISLLSIMFYVDSIYFKPLIDVYESFCVAALFLLYVEYVCPEEEMRPKYFNDLENKDKKGNIIPGGSLKWFNRTWITVLQFPLTKTLSCIVEISTQAAGVFCANSLSPRYAHIWLLLIDMFIIGGAVSAVIKFYIRLKKEINPKHHPLAKLLAFKGVVFFQFFQEIIFGFLNGKIFQPSRTMTYDDIYYGIPMMLTALEAMLFSFAFHFAFRSREYHAENRPDAHRLSTWRAILDALNLSDIVHSVILAFHLFLTKNSPNGFNNPAPRRQRTSELDDMSREPLTDSRWPESATPVPETHGHMAVGAQQYGIVRGYGNEREELSTGYGYDKYRAGYLGIDGTNSRDPSPSRLAQKPRDMV